MPTENRSSKTEVVSVPFQREDRYIVIKRSDLANVPADYRTALVDSISPLLAHLPSREYLVIKSDWPEYETAWSASPTAPRRAYSVDGWYCHLVDQRRGRAGCG